MQHLGMIDRLWVEKQPGQKGLCEVSEAALQRCVSHALQTFLSQQFIMETSRASDARIRSVQAPVCLFAPYRFA